MGKFDNIDFGIFIRAMKGIKNEYSNILTFFSDDIHEFIASEKNPFGVSVNIQEVIDYVDKHYAELSGVVSKVFESVGQCVGLSDNFVKYYSLLDEYSADSKCSTDSSDFDKTMCIAIVLTFINNKINTPVTKKIQIVLKSMCKQPTVGALVQVSSRVLAEV